MEYKNRFEKYRLTHPELVKQRIEGWKKKNRKHIREYDRAYSKTEIFKTNRHNYHRKLVEKYKKEVFKLLGGKCCRCGFSDPRGFQIDHVNGGGHKQRHGMGSEMFLRYVIKHLEEFQLLCANCNQIKRIENKEN